MDERDYKAMQAGAEVLRMPRGLTPKQQAEFLNAKFSPTIHPPSCYDIYRYAKDESAFYDKEADRLVSEKADKNFIQETVAYIDFFESIREWADLRLMRYCQEIAKAEGFENPFAADYATT